MWRLLALRRWEFERERERDLTSGKDEGPRQGAEKKPANTMKADARTKERRRNVEIVYLHQIKIWNERKCAVHLCRADAKLHAIHRVSQRGWEACDGAAE